MEHIGCYLKDVYLNKKSGRLIFKNKGIQRYLFFMDGFLIFAKTNHPQEMLGEILFKLGKISEDTYSDIDNYIEPKKKIGEILIKDNCVSQSDLKEALIYQMREITLNIFSIFEGKFKFQEKKDFVEQEFESKIDIPILIEDGIRRMKYNFYLKEFMKDKVLLPKKKDFFYRLTEEEKGVLETINGHSLAEAILSSSHFSAEHFWKSLFLFYCLDLIDVKVEEKISVKEKAFEQSSSETSERHIENILELRKKLPSLDFYQVLSVSQTASQSEIKKAYFHLARRYHPDSFGRNLPLNIEEKIGEVFDFISKAYHVLSDEAKRRDYDSKIAVPPQDDKRDLAKKAEIKFRQGKTLYDIGKHEDALILLEEAVRLTGSKGSYYLLLAMAESKIPLFSKKAERDFLRAIRLESWNAEGYVGLGLLYKQEGLLVRARKQFEKALILDPEHKIALKELGLFGKDEKKRGLKELLSLELFGKKKE